MRSILRAAVAPALLLGAIVVTIVRYAPPAARGPDADPSAFSAARARGHLEVVAAAPRPVGSAQHDRVRDYLVRALEAEGLRPELRRVVTARGATLARVDNLVTTLPGTAEPVDGRRPTVAIMAHYDSVPSGPGAGDDGAAVAAMLETVRALRTGPPPRNDLAFVLTDAEEAGLLGAAALADAPYDVVVNFEARGARGPALMFETGRDDALVIEHFARLPRPIGGSLYVEVYRRMPNDTDFSWFRGTHRGMNFAFIDGVEAYHTALDDLDRLSMDSVQHHGDNMLALARSLGDADLGAPGPRGSVVFFDLLGSVVVRYPVSVALPAALGLLALLLVVMALARRSRGLSLVGVALGGVLALGGAAAGAAVATLAWWGARAAVRPAGALASSRLVLLVFTLAAVAAAAALATPIRRRVARAELMLGAATLWALLAVALAATLPGASYALFAPALVAGAAGAGALASPERRRGWWAPALLAPAALVFVPLVLGFHAALTASAAPVTGAVIGLAAGGLLPPLLPRRLAGLVAAILDAGALLALAAVVLGGAPPDHRRPSSLGYVLDADTGSATYVSSDPAPNEWTEHALGGSPERRPLPDLFPRAPIEFLVADAPVLELPPPGIARERVGPREHVVTIDPGPRAARLDVLIEGAEPPAHVEVDGRSLGSIGSFRYWAPVGPLRVRLRLAGDGDPAVTVRVLRDGLPEGLVPPRPSHLMQARRGLGLPDFTIVQASAGRSP